MKPKDMEPWGECSQCGLCCLSKGGRYICEHLEVITAVGEAGGTRCKVYGERWHLMTIRMLDRERGRASYVTECLISEQMPFEERRRNLPAGCTLVNPVLG